MTVSHSTLHVCSKHLTIHDLGSSVPKNHPIPPSITIDPRLQIEMPTLLEARNWEIESIRDRKSTSQCKGSAAIGLDSYNYQNYSHAQSANKSEHYTDSFAKAFVVLTTCLSG